VSSSNFAIFSTLPSNFEFLDLKLFRKKARKAVEGMGGGAEEKDVKQK
jgi:hypothetical protein